MYNKGVKNLERKMKTIPDSIKEKVSNAIYFLKAADKHPSPTQDAVQTLLLLIGWENLTIARQELLAWSKKEDVDPKIYKSHAAKLKQIPKVKRIIIDSKGRVKEINFLTGKDFEDLRLACQFGSNTESKNVEAIFKTGWHLNGLRNGLKSAIEWMNTIIRAEETLLNKEKN